MKDYNGIIVINKPKNYTSRDIVNILGKTLNQKKIGHTGTLDPLATGVLVCVLGKCTKLCDVLTCNEKEYKATMKFGVLTDTLDITGTVLKTSKLIPSLEDIQEAFKHFTGSYNQEVPLYSSVKVHGKKLYEYARNKEEIKLPKKEVTIKKIELLKIDNEYVQFKVLVSKGTYIRSLIRDIGSYLNTYATMTDLERLSQGKFTLKESYTLEDIEKGNFKLITLEEIFDCYPKEEVNEEKFQQIKNGREFNNTYNSSYVLFTYQNNLVALYTESKKDKKKIKPLILV